MEIIFTAEAEGDVEDVLEYMANKNLDVVREISRQIQYTCKLLSKMPKMGMATNLLIEMNEVNNEIQEVVNAKKFFKKMRKFSVVNFDKLIIFYQVVDNTLEVVRVLHSSRDIPTILAMNNEV